MMLYCVIAVLLLHFSVLPIVIVGRANVDTDDNAGSVDVKLYFIPVFVKRFSTDKIFEKPRTPSDGQAENESREKKRVGAFAKNFALSVLSRIRVYAADICGVIGTGDAAVSAVAVGGIRVAFDNVCAFTDFKGGECEVSPDYDRELAKIAVFGIISLCIADIIIATVAAGIKTLATKTCEKRKRSNYANIITE